MNQIMILFKCIMLFYTAIVKERARKRKAEALKRRPVGWLGVGLWVCGTRGCGWLPVSSGMVGAVKVSVKGLSQQGLSLSLSSYRLHTP